jgi:ankyrin repeat protein
MGLLLRHAETDPNCANNEVWTPLYISAHDGNEGLVKQVKQLLLHLKANSKLNEGVKPLMLAH